MKCEFKVQQKKTASGIEYEVGSDNIFADLGLPNPEDLMLKAQLAMQIRELILKRNLTQAEVAQATGISQPRVSRLLNGYLSDFSTERLFTVLQRLGHNVEIRIKPQAVAPEKARARVLVG